MTSESACGEVPEWSNGAVSKTVVRLRTQGSNPCLSATIKRPRHTSKRILKK